MHHIFLPSVIPPDMSTHPSINPLVCLCVALTVFSCYCLSERSNDVSSLKLISEFLISHNHICTYPRQLFPYVAEPSALSCDWAIQYVKSCPSISHWKNREIEKRTHGIILTVLYDVHNAFVSNKEYKTL